MELSAVRQIARPAAEVFTFLADAANNPSWQRGMRGCQWTSPPPIGVGSTYRQEASFLGRSVVSSFEVTEFEPGHTITFSTVAGSFPITVRRSVEPLGPERCRVEAAIWGEPGRRFVLVGPLLRRMAQRSVDADYDRLVTLLEA